MKNACHLQINLITMKTKLSGTQFSFKKHLLPKLILLLKIIFLPVAIVWFFGLFIFENILQPIVNNLKVRADSNIRNFTWRFALMIEAGLPLVSILNILAITAKGKFAKAIAKIKLEVETGATLADAMRNNSALFSSMYVNLIAAGEIGGILDTVLLRLNDYYRLKIYSQKKLIHFSWILGMMLQTGVPILDALQICAGLFARNKKFAKAIKLMRHRISEGQYIANAMMECQSEKHILFPAIFVQMIAVGENTGLLDQMLIKYAEYSMENE